MSSKYLRTDTRADALESLSNALELSARVSRDPEKWKWLVIALHASVQALMVLALERGNGLQTQRSPTRKKWLKAYEAGSALPPDDLNSFMSLYADIKTEKAEGYVDSKRFVAKPRHDKAMKQLNVTRNDWIHFNPKGWSIEFRFLSETCLSVLDIIEFLALRSESFHWHSLRNERTAKVLIEGLRGNLEALDTLYASAS